MRAGRERARESVCAVLERGESERGLSFRDCGCENDTDQEDVIVVSIAVRGTEQTWC
jgi:hypothetical protein